MKSLSSASLFATAVVVLSSGLAQAANAEKPTMTPLADSGGTGSLPIRKLSSGDGASSLGYYNTCPESPDGKRVVYVRFVNPPTSARAAAPAELFVCDTGSEKHRKLADVTVLVHNSAMAQWIDNRRVVYQTGGRNGGVCVVDVDSGKTMLGPVRGELGHSVVKNEFLLAPRPQNGELAKAGLVGINFDTGAERMILSLGSLSRFKDDFPNLGDPAKWIAQHGMFSPNGERVAVRILAGNGDDALVIAGRDGSGFYVLPGKKPLHQLWFDDETLWGVDTGDHQVKRWDLKGNSVETMAGEGCHIGISPDYRWIAAETYYGSNPIVLRLYRRGEMKPVATIFSHRYPNAVWELQNHVNPAFSRDGKRLYFNLAISDDKSQAWVADISSLLVGK